MAICACTVAASSRSQAAADELAVVEQLFGQGVPYAVEAGSGEDCAPNGRAFLAMPIVFLGA